VMIFFSYCMRDMTELICMRRLISMRKQRVRVIVITEIFIQRRKSITQAHETCLIELQ
jgi:hypothetical protein